MKTHSIIETLKAILQTQMVSTQHQIRHLLERKGHKVNQVKISRLLHKLGAIKVAKGDLIVYQLPLEPSHITVHNTLRQLVLSITHNESLIVVHTAPGSAQVVARFLDLKANRDVLGIVAGDDTIFVAPLSTKRLKTLFNKIYQQLME